MCCGAALWEPGEEEILGWIADGYLLEELAPDEVADEPGAWRAVMRDPGAFAFAFRIESGRARRLFGDRAVAAGGQSAPAS